MPWTISTPILTWAVIFISLFVLLWIFPPRVKVNAILVFLSFLAANLFFVFAVNWSVVNYWLRVLPLILSVLLIIRFVRANQPYYDFKLDRKAVTPWVPGKRNPSLAVFVISLLVLAVSSYLDFRVLQSTSYRSYQGKPVLLFHPLRYGLYVVVNGGNGLDGIGMNDVYQDWLGRKTGDPSMAYAVDLMKMRNNRGWISKGTLPSSKQAYDSYGEPVFAPCVGTVVYIEDGHQDVVLGAPETPLGNRIVIQCFEYYVTVANLKKGSVIVKEGEKIGYKYQIGQVGSSGYPSVPHLRIFTTLGSWDQNGTPVPQLFDVRFRFLMRNDLVLPNY